MNSSVYAWKSQLAQTITYLGFASLLFYTYVWMQKDVNPYGFNYWWCALIHTDQIMLISHEAGKIKEGVAKVYSLKKGSEMKNAMDVKRYKILNK